MANHFWNEINTIKNNLTPDCRVVTDVFDHGRLIGLAFFTPYGMHAVRFCKYHQWRMGRKHARSILRTMQHKTNYKAFMNGNQG